MSYLSRKFANLPLECDESPDVVVSDAALLSMVEFDQEYSFDVNAYARRAFGVKVTESDDVV